MTVKALKKQLMAAIAMVVVSAIALSSSTYAWFSMNTQVTAKSMAVTAKAESGLAIAAYTRTNADNDTVPADSAFNNEATANVTSQANVIPTFTNDAVKWYHTSSKMSSNGQAYVDAGYADVSSDSEHVYYLLNKFQIKSTGGDAQAVYVKNITVTRGVNATEQDYDPSLRVLIKSGDATLIFAPLNSNQASETALATTAAEDAVEANITATYIAVDTTEAKILNDVVATPEDVLIYVYYSGEDPACKSDNIPSGEFNQLTVDVVFTSVAPTDS